MKCHTFTRTKVNRLDCFQAAWSRRLSSNKKITEKYQALRQIIKREFASVGKSEQKSSRFDGLSRSFYATLFFLPFRTAYLLLLLLPLPTEVSIMRPEQSSSSSKANSSGPEWWGAGEEDDEKIMPEKLVGNLAVVVAAATARLEPNKESCWGDDGEGEEQEFVVHILAWLNQERGGGGRYWVNQGFGKEESRKRGRRRIQFLVSNRFWWLLNLLFFVTLSLLLCLWDGSQCKGEEGLNRRLTRRRRRLRRRQGCCCSSTQANQAAAAAAAPVCVKENDPADWLTDWLTDKAVCLLLLLLSLLLPGGWRRRRRRRSRRSRYYWLDIGDSISKKC